MLVSRSHDDYARTYESGTRAKGQYRCPECGYGVTIQDELPTCPMCGGTSWEAAAAGPVRGAREEHARVRVRL